MVRAVPWCCRMQMPPLLLLLLLLTLLPQGLCLGGLSGQRAEVAATRISCRPAVDFPEGVNMGKSGRMSLMRKVRGGQTVVYACVDSNQSCTPHDDLGTVLLKVTPGNELRIDLYLVRCPCADSEECPHHPDPAKIEFVCDYAFGPKGNTVSPEPFEKPANVSDVKLSPAVCCTDEQCPEGGAANISAIVDPRSPVNGNDSDKERPFVVKDVVIGVLLTCLVVALFANAYMFRKNRRLQVTIASRCESEPMNTPSA